MSTSNVQQPEKERQYGTICSCIVGFGVWMFLTSDPSPVAWIIAWLLLAYLILGYCLLELHIMEMAPSGDPTPVQVQSAPPLQLDLDHLLKASRK